MGNRAVITTEKNWENDGVGIYLHWNGDAIKAKVAGHGKDEWVNGTNVKGIPYVDLYGENPKQNINNYLVHKEWRKIV